LILAGARRRRVLDQFLEALTVFVVDLERRVRQDLEEAVAELELCELLAL